LVLFITRRARANCLRWRAWLVKLMAVTSPPAEGVRVAWEDLPGFVRAAIQEICGSAVIEARTQPGGFSPGVAARVVCADGTRHFVKAVSAEANPDSPGLHRQEGEVLAALDAVIVARRLPIPRLRGTVDRDPWVALVLEDVFLAPSVAMQGGPDLAEVLALSKASRNAGRPDLAATVCAVSGYLTQRSLEPAPAGLPTVRAFQAAQGAVARRWLAGLL
jgi:hypothetical protein